MNILIVFSFVGVITSWWSMTVTRSNSHADSIMYGFISESCWCLLQRDLLKLLEFFVCSNHCLSPTVWFWKRMAQYKAYIYRKGPLAIGYTSTQKQVIQYKKTLMHSIKYAAISIVLLDKFWWTRGPSATLAHLSKQLLQLKNAF